MSAWLKYNGGGCPVAPWLKVEVSVDGGQILAARNANDWPWADPDFRVAKYRVVDAAPASTDWIEWNGGECPVAKGVDVEVRFRDETSESHKSEYFRWGHHSMTFYGNSSRDIVAYRLVDAPRASTDSALSHQPNGTHYSDAAIQPVQFIEANKLGFLEGCIVKRATRHSHPTGKGAEDIRKIIHEAQLLLQLRYGEMV